MDEEAVKPCIQDRFKEFVRERVRNVRRWWEENFPYFIIGFSFLIALYFFVHPGLRQEYWSSFFPGYVATGLGVLIGTSLTLLQMRAREQVVHNKFLRDIFVELKQNSVWLVGKGHILNTDIWDSGISSGSILGIASKELDELSEVYHQIEVNIYESKICREAGEYFRRLSVSPDKNQAEANWAGLSKFLDIRESNLKRQIDDFLKKDFWEKAGIIRG